MPASELTDKIRTAYPHQYDDLSDSDLESKILSKHPEYKDLADKKLPSNNTSQTDNAVNPVNDSAPKASLTPLDVPTSEANARSDNESISASKSLSKGNLEANRATGQDNIIHPDEHESLLSKGWKLISDAANSETGKMLLEGHNNESDRLNKEAGITRTLGPELTKIPYADKLAEFVKTQGRNTGNYAGGFAGSVLGDLIDLGSVFDPRAVGLGKSGINELHANELPLPENTPVFKGSEPTVASEQFPELLKDEAGRVLGPSDNPIQERPNGPWNDNVSNEVTKTNPEDRLLDIIKNKQNMGKELPIDLNNESDIPSPPVNSPITFNKPGIKGSNINSKPSLLLNLDGTFTNKETGEMFDMRGHRVNESLHKPGSLIDSTDQMNNREITHEGGSNEHPSNEPPNPNDPNPESRKTTLSDIINFPKALKASWDLSAPGRQGLGLIHTKAWWNAWSDMFSGLKSDEAFKATQKAIENRPLFKSFNDEPSFAQKAGLKLTNLGKLSDREESFMSSLAEKFPGVKLSERAYTAYLNKLRADTFENLMSKYKVLGENGEYNIPLSKELANYINNATGRGSLDDLESSAVALNNAFFSPRFLASRLKLLGESGKSVFTPSTYVFSQPSVRREYLKSLLAIAGVGTTIGELAKMAGGTVEHDSNNSDFMKIKVGNTRIDPYAGMQQPIVLASRLLSGKSTSSVSGKETDLDNPKYGQSNRMDVIGRFARSKESPVVAFAHGLLTGKDGAGNRFNVPEEVVQLFTPMILQDLKQVATENPNLIPYMHEEGLGLENTDMKRGMLALPGMIGAGVSNYPSKVQN